VGDLLPKTPGFIHTTLHQPRGADLHIAQQMPLPLTISCSSKSRLVFTFLAAAHPGGPGQIPEEQ